MTKTTQALQTPFVSVGVFMAVFIFSFVLVQRADASITGDLDIGSRGTQVSELQRFLAADPLTYPRGIVSGYFGPLTHAAVLQFQVAYDISQVGRVGPITRARINSIMASGMNLDTSAPVIRTLSVQVNRTDAVVGWTTNEVARGQVFYDTSPIRFVETSPTGISATNNSGLHFSHSVTLQNLQPNTLYHYVIRSMDNAGNLTLTLANVFRTDQ